MDDISIDSFTSDDITCENIIPKLRRLKMQQNILQKALNGLKQTSEINSNESLDLKNFFNHLKTSYREIRNLFEDVKDSVKPQNVENIDIQEIRKDIVSLETKIKAFKEFLRSELEALKKEELSLIDQINDDDKRIAEIKTTKIRNLRHKIISSSPVKVMIDSPFKCLEVQQLQDFLKNSPNRYGGWNEYNHNIFVQIWNKYYGKDIQHLPLDDDAGCPDFRNEILHKISGLTEDDVISHGKWYLKYLHLKINQQRALDKWKDNRRKIKKNAQSSQAWKYEHPNKMQSNQKLCRKQSQSSGEEQDNISIETEDDSSRSKAILSYENEIISAKKIDETSINRLMKPTKQWINKCEGAKEDPDSYKNIEYVKKLRVPNWRLVLGSS